MNSRFGPTPKIRYHNDSIDGLVESEMVHTRPSNYVPTMMLLMGMWINFTKKPMKPMMANPIAVAIAIF